MDKKEYLQQWIDAANAAERTLIRFKIDLMYLRQNGVEREPFEPVMAKMREEGLMAG